MSTERSPASHGRRGPAPTAPVRRTRPAGAREPPLRATAAARALREIREAYRVGLQGRAETLAGVRSRVARAIGYGTACGEVAEGVDAAEQALRIVAFTEGLALHTHIDPDGTPESAVLAALDDQLGRVFTGTCRHRTRGR
ncbi:TetR family transcriptional regulator C-terminal domain-containing protein [Streptomyces sp. WZ.A104]|uniref:TetR family transcriptional regulator C-terminal domain-containing protein n=1 Tax=Streptomyces sp. WZ.A104 TaxID=2023771 RepID=UPI00211BA801|nr:TetR family transcriptional regulator C-terminal domain-containing protein [Streptomyces sp. WZ.A104]